MRGHSSIIDMLIKAGCDVNALDKNKWFCSCLSVGVCCGQLFYGAEAQHGAVAGPRKFRDAPP